MDQDDLPDGGGLFNDAAHDAHAVLRRSIHGAVWTRNKVGLDVSLISHWPLAPDRSGIVLMTP